VHRELNAVSTVEALAADLAERILGGELPPGTALREIGLAEEYRVGRHTVRAALQRLGHQGLVRQERNRGASVPHLTDSDVRDLYLLRSLIEAAVVRHLAEQRIRPLQAEGALRAFESLEEGTPWAKVVEADLAVHRALVAAAGSPRLDRLYDPLAAEMRLCMAQLRPFYQSPRELAEEHEEVLRAIASHDGDAAAEVMRRHLAMAVSDLTGGPVEVDPVSPATGGKQ
jgi:DNA-binding GntR family transcriptional regulator